MKSISSKQAMAHAIPQSVKRKVSERDDGLCLWCGKPGASNAHYIARSMGGKGIEENILTLCPKCHNEYDNGFAVTRARMKARFREYLFNYYDNWDEAKLIYHKWEDI